MTIGIDATALYGRYGGVEYALWNLLDVLRARDETHRFVVYIPRDGPPRERSRRFGPRWKWVRLPFEGGQKARRILWQQLQLPRRVERDGCDILHAPTYVCPVNCRIPVVLTVYDLIALNRPQFATRANRLHYGLLLGRSIQRAKRVIVPSERVMWEIEARFPGALHKIEVVPPGLEPIFFRDPTPEERRDVRARYNLPPRYLLYVGNFEPKKNGATLLRALHDWEAVNPGTLPPLVVAGGVRPWPDDALTTVRSARVQRIGYVWRRDLPALYAECSVFLFPSLAEGLGLPVLEAMACGAPVVTSREVPLPGLANHAVLVDPRDRISVALASHTILDNPGISDAFHLAGRRYTRNWTCETSAQNTMRVYENVGPRPEFSVPSWTIPTP